jgi:hypothetical protein
MLSGAESAAMSWLCRLGVTTPEMVVVADEQILTSGSRASAR